MRRRLVANITPQERAARVLLGLAGVVSAVLLLPGAAAALASALAVLLGFAGLDLIVTGALGQCPLSARLGHVPASLRRS